MLRTFAAGPRIGRPSAENWKAVACRWSNSTSSDSFSTSSISRRMTERSRSTAAASSELFCRMSARMSTAAPTSFLNTCARGVRGWGERVREGSGCAQRSVRSARAFA